MSSMKMLVTVVEWIKELGGSALIILEACQETKLEKSYKLIKENSLMTLDQFVEETEIVEEE